MNIVKQLLLTISSVFSKRSVKTKVKSSATIFQRIGGIALMIFGVLLSMFLICVPLALSTGTGKEAVPVFAGIGTLGVLLIIMGFDIYKGLLSKTSYEKFVEKNKKALAHQDYETSQSDFNDDCDDYTDDFDLKNVSSVDGMDGHDFEYFCADILRKNGFLDVSVTKGSGDQGVDILAIKDGIKYAVQCKNYASALSNTPVQEVNAGKTFYNCHVGVVMTNSTFTPGAKALAQATGVLLWDRTVLQKMMEDAN